MRKHPRVLRIPFTAKKYKWNSYSNRYEKTRGEHTDGDDGLEFEGRVYTYHPTKGWRSRNSRFVLPY